MTTKKGTINLQGKNYKLVAERLREVHKDNKGNISITTAYEITPAGATVFTATVTIKDKVFTGHSYGKSAAVKAFEKQETIAVGRALAFAGYHGDGDIASADEMQDYGKDVDTEALAHAIGKIQGATTVKDLNKAYREMPVELKGNKEVIEAGKAKKKELTTIQ